MKPPVEFPANAVLNVDEVAAYLRVNRDLAYEYVKESIPHYTEGRSFRIPFWTLREWVEKRCNNPA